MDVFGLLIEWWPSFLSGAWLTIQLVLLSAALGLALAVPLALALVARTPALRWPAYGYSLFFRGTPLLVQIFLIYYGVGQFAWIRDSVLWSVLREPYACALIAFSLNAAAYTGELLRGGIRAVPRGEIEAARAIGMHRGLAYRIVILPRAFRVILPAYSNELVMLLKASSLASTITLLDLMGVARLAVAKTYAAVEFFILAGLIYYALVVVISHALARIEKRTNRYAVLAR
jgi:His/Glu/Gln/Arg/opine family amino acid ABC transporter permease subunit